MRFLKKTMLERVRCSETDLSNVVTLPRSFQGSGSALPNVRLHFYTDYGRKLKGNQAANIPFFSQNGSNISERDLRTELKHESDVELVDENENTAHTVFPIKSENNGIVESSIPRVANQKKSVESDQNSCTVVFVDTDALVMSVCIKKVFPLWILKIIYLFSMKIFFNLELLSLF